MANSADNRSPADDSPTNNSACATAYNICFYSSINKKLILSNLHFRHSIASYVCLFCIISKQSHSWIDANEHIVESFLNKSSVLNRLNERLSGYYSHLSPPTGISMYSLQKESLKIATNCILAEGFKQKSVLLDMSTYETPLDHQWILCSEWVPVRMSPVLPIYYILQSKSCLIWIKKEMCTDQAQFTSKNSSKEMC